MRALDLLEFILQKTPDVFIRVVVMVERQTGRQIPERSILKRTPDKPLWTAANQHFQTELAVLDGVFNQLEQYFLFLWVIALVEPVDNYNVR